MEPMYSFFWKMLTRFSYVVFHSLRCSILGRIDLKVTWRELCLYCGGDAKSETPKKRPEWYLPFPRIKNHRRGKRVEKELISHLWPLLNLKANTKSMDQAMLSVFKDVNIITSFHPDENDIARKGTLPTLQSPPKAICFLESSHQ